MVYTPDGMKPLSMIKFNPLVAVYRTITTNSLIGSKVICRRHFTVHCGSTVYMNYKGFNFRGVYFKGEFHYEVLGTLGNVKLSDITDEIMERAKRHMTFLHKHFTGDRFEKICLYQNRQPLAVLK